MAIIKVQKGTKDILPAEMPVWHFMEDEARKIFTEYGGDTTDIVNKEMYTFEKSERSLTLRPENTAGVVRAFIENGMHRLSAPVKLWYKGPMFRYERPQAGRQRQFHHYESPHCKYFIHRSKFRTVFLFIRKDTKYQSVSSPHVLRYQRYDLHL